jgi:hypothetical protein
VGQRRHPCQLRRAGRRKTEISTDVSSLPSYPAH